MDITNRIDLQDQVRDHIKSHELFNWHEALTEEEMSLLENLLLTFAPMFYPDSVGFNETVQPYLKEAEKRIEELEKGLQYILANSLDYHFVEQKAKQLLTKQVK